MEREDRFSAGITYDAGRREAVIGFAGLGASKSSFAQSVRCVMDWLGFVPKNMSQASKLTQLVKSHVDELNPRLPEDQPIKLTLTATRWVAGSRPTPRCATACRR